jgi:hypothetical protein
MFFMDGEKQNYKCPNCASMSTIWIGYRQNISGRTRIRRCKDCRRKFTPKNIFLRARFNRIHVIEAVALHSGGLSLDRVRSHMHHHRNVNVSRTTILKWSKKYSQIVDEFSKKLRHVIRGVVHCDDIYFEIAEKRIIYSGVIDSKIIFKISSKLPQSIADET